MSAAVPASGWTPPLLKKDSARAVIEVDGIPALRSTDAIREGLTAIAYALLDVASAIANPQLAAATTTQKNWATTTAHETPLADQKQ